jgi:hypothetical protein
MFRSLTVREENADRAFRGAILGLLFIPIEFYAVWLVLNVLSSEERMSNRSRNRTVWAAVISLPLVLLMLFVLASLIIKK